jgi:hypothetical protein
MSEQHGNRESTALFHSNIFPDFLQYSWRIFSATLEVFTASTYLRFDNTSLLDVCYNCHRFDVIEKALALQKIAHPQLARHWYLFCTYNVHERTVHMDINGLIFDTIECEKLLQQLYKHIVFSNNVMFVK